MFMMNTKSGFTIVELLMVIVVIAILAAISIVSYTGIQNRARLSAYQREASETERRIMTYALQENSEIATIVGGSLVGFKENAGDIELLRPLTGTPDITMYSVLEAVGANSTYSAYAYLTPLTWGNHVFSLDVGNTGETIMRGRVDTSLQSNLVVASPSGYYVSGKTNICWIEADHANALLSLGCNRGAAHQSRSFNTAHAGWNFTGLRLVDRTDKVRAGYVFSSAHNETTRTQVVNWLANKYGVSL